MAAFPHSLNMKVFIKPESHTLSTDMDGIEYFSRLFKENATLN